MENYLEILRIEFDAEEGSFLLLLRVQNEWSKDAFTRLTTAMQACCEAQEGDAPVERWLAQGFWFVFITAEGFVTHSAFRSVHDPEYYKAAIDRLLTLGDWFFFGESPYIEGSAIEPL